MEYAQKKLEYKFKLQLQTAQVAQAALPQPHSMANRDVYPAQTPAQTSYTFQQPQPEAQQEFSPFSGQFSFSNYNSYSSQASSDSLARWQPNMASSSTPSQGSLSSATQAASGSFPLESQSASPYSGWEQTPAGPHAGPSPTDDNLNLKKSESLSFTEQLNNDSEDLYN
jgi:hypothetical protein